MSRRLVVGAALMAVVAAAIVAVVVAARTATPSRAPAREAADAEAGFPATVEPANGAIRIEARPQRIVSLSTVATEILFAIGAREQVVAVDRSSDYPPEAPRTALSGLTPNAEAIARFRPDLVFASDDRGVVRTLERLGIPVLHEPAARNLDETYGQIRRAGAATGHRREAAALAESMQSAIQRSLADVPKRSPAPTVFHELSPDLYTVTSRTFIGQVYELFGFHNIADEPGRAASDYPQLSAEYVLAADPDLIVLADSKCCGQSARTVAGRPGWDNLTAVKRGRVVVVDDSIASRWGPRIVLFFREIARAAGG